MIMAVTVAGCATPGDPEAPDAEQAVVPEPARREEAAKPTPEVAAAAVGSIDLTELFGLVDGGDVLLLDVRPPLFHKLGHIPGSLGLPRKKYSQWIGVEEGRIKEAAAAGRDVVLYCANLECPDASAVAADLSKRGIPVKVFHGGWEEWKAADLPVE